MSFLEDREQAQEQQFVHSAEKHFKIEARRDKLAAHWAAAILHQTEAEELAYVAALITAEVAHPGSADVIAKLKADLAGQVDPSEIEAKMAQFLVEAKAQIEAEA